MKKSLLFICMLLLSCVTLISGCKNTKNDTGINARSLYNAAIKNTNSIKNTRSIITSQANDLQTEGEVIQNTTGNKVYFTGTTPEMGDQQTEFLYDDGSIYIYDSEQEKYIYISADNPMSEFMSLSLTTSTKSTFSQYEAEFMDKLSDEDFTMKTIDYILDGEKQSATKIEVNMSSDDAVIFFEKSMLDMFEASIDYQIEMLIQMENSFSDATYTKEELEGKKEEYRRNLTESITSMFENLKITDIQYSVIIDNDNIVRHTEESFTTTLPDQEPQTTNTVIELVEYGDHILCPEIDKSKIISYEDLLKNE